MLKNSGSKAVMPQMVRMFAKTARQRIRPESGHRRRVLARRVEVAAGEVRIIGSKCRMLQTLVSSGGVNTVPIQEPSWRRERDSNPHIFPTFQATQALLQFRQECLELSIGLSNRSAGDNAAFPDFREHRIGSAAGP
jgi:hypothetical protein